MTAPQSLYRKYRPRAFADLVGQEHVTRSVRNALKAGLVNHAYLFCGPRGSGKTSLAKLIAKAVTCQSPREGEPCNECPSCRSADAGTNLDVMEIDAASNRKIDDIRHLRDQVAYAPVGGRRKVYIIDEAHMLTKEAANAFLKTLEEPPSHVIFILATTEPDAIIPTILSRCQRYDFRKLSLDACLRRLQDIVDHEQPLELTQEARCFLAARGDGSMRDVLSLLDQAISYCGRTIDRPDVERTLGLVRHDVVEHVAEAVVDGRTGDVVRAVEEVARGGTELGTFLGQLVEHFRSVLLVKSGNGDLLVRLLGQEVVTRLAALAERVPEPRLVAVLRRLSSVGADLRAGMVPLFALEVGLLEAMNQDAGSSDGRTGSRLSRLEAVLAAAPAAVAAAPVPRSAPAGEVQPPTAGDRGAPTVPASPAGGAAETWRRLTTRMRKEYPLTYAFVVEARFRGVDGTVITLGFDARHSFHKAKLSEVKHEAILKKFIAEEYGTDVRPRLVDEEDEGGGGEAAPAGSGAPGASGPPTSGGGGRSAPPARGAVTGRDWYEQKALKNRKVQELLEGFEAEVLSVE